MAIARAPRAIPQRATHACPTESSIHRAALRRGHAGRRNPVVRHGVCRWPPAHRVLPAAPVIDPGAPANVSYRMRGGPACASACHHPPGSETVQRPGEARRHAQAARFWHCQTTRRPGPAGGSNPHWLAPDDTVLVRPDGTLRLLDFGIAKQLDSLDQPVDQTLTGLRLMTPAYAAPEQVRGGPVGVYTDVYSLGVILYELLAGRLPFDLSDRTPAEAVAMIAERQ